MLVRESDGTLRVKVIEFGLAKFVVSQDEDDSLDGMAWGGRHAGFASPEQLPNRMKRCVPTFIPGSYALVHAYWQDNRWRLSYKNHSTV
jgi:hypothetical protein